MKYNKIIIAAAMLLTGFAYTSCSDEWDEHYEVRTQGDGTLWETLSNNSELSNFTAVLEAAGYKDALDGSQVFTVFAPTNSELTDTERDALIAQYNSEKLEGVKEKKNSVVKEFVQNHIALYNYSTSSQSEQQDLRMMNGKYLSFGSDGFDGISYQQQNIATNNGVLFIINGQSTYKPNVYEYIYTDTSLDSVATFLKHYEEEVFYANLSVPGEIIDGQINYLDSVTETYNEVVEDWLEAQLNNEDSSYVSLLPNNEQWSEMLQRYEQYFKYDKEVSERDSFEYIYPRYRILDGTQFSAIVNPGIENNEAVDSVISTNAPGYLMRQNLYGDYDAKYYVYEKPFAEDGIFATANTTDVACSNGTVKTAATWPIDPEMTFLQKLVYEGESSTFIDSLNLHTSNNRGNTQSATYVSVSTDNPFYNQISGHSYLELKPSGTNNLSNAVFNMENVLSNVPYNVYIQLATDLAGDTLSTDTVPTSFWVVMQCHDINGNAVYITPQRLPVDNNTLGELTTVTTRTVTPYTVSTSTVPTSIRRRNMDYGDGKSVHKVLVGQYLFPTCSYDTSEPQVKMLLTGSATSSLSKTIRIDCVIFEPALDDMAAE